MSDNTIHDSTPAGNVILAYGESSPRFAPRQRFLIAGGGIVVALLCSVIFFLHQIKIPLPENTVVLAYAHASTPLPTGSSDTWKNAQRDAAPFPALYGFTKNETGLHPFAIPLGFKKKLLSDQAEAAAQNRSLSSLGFGITSYFSSAWLRVWPERVMGKGNEQESLVLAGPIKNGVWSTKVPISTAPSKNESATDTPNTINFQHLPQAWPIISELLENMGWNTAFDEAPTALHWSWDKNSNLSLQFDFLKPLSTETKAKIAGNEGIFDHTSYTLADGTVMREDRLPLRQIETATSGKFELSEEKKLIFIDTSVLIGNEESFNASQKLPETKDCTGSTLATFDQISVAKIFSAIGLPPQNLTSLTFKQAGGELRICW